MTRLQREKMYEELLHAFEFGEGWVTAVEIDRFGLSKALKLGAFRALKKINADTEEDIFLDGMFNYLPRKYKNSECLINGDNIIPFISAASIYAKVTRDNFMIRLAKKYPLYNFESHVGYGTKTHMLALKSHGAIKYVHRYSYAPVAQLSGV